MEQSKELLKLIEHHEFQTEIEIAFNIQHVEKVFDFLYNNEIIKKYEQLQNLIKASEKLQSGLMRIRISKSNITTHQIYILQNFTLHFSTYLNTLQNDKN
jgi:hypothetical protein